LSTQYTDDLAQLKILILSTPKTGNTWLEALLSAIYDLPIVEISGTWDDYGYHFNAEEADALGARWIAHHHFSNDSDIVRWSQDRGVIIVTTLRHPADTIVSLYHYARNYADGLPGQPKILDFVTHDSNLFDPDRDRAAIDREKLAEYLHTAYFHLLAISRDWIDSGHTRAVRYEDLWLDPVRTLTVLTATISTVPTGRIERAIAASDISLMRQTAGENAKFFRKGGTGSWRTQLPPEINDILRHEEPYPMLFSQLGYTMDPDDPLYHAPRANIPENPFASVSQFDNGVPVSPFIVRYYLSLDPSQHPAWSPSISAADEGSFYAWLNLPSADDPAVDGGVSLVTNLAAYIYHTRRDVQQVFPDLWGADRTHYILWFLRRGENEHLLDPIFLATMRESFLSWATAMPPKGAQQGTGLLPNYLIYLYHHIPSLQEAFPDAFDGQYRDYIAWFIGDELMNDALDQEVRRRICMRAESFGLPSKEN
jgi:hypothetical protein